MCIRDRLESGSEQDNGTTLQDVVSAIKTIASVQQENAREIRDMKEEMKGEIRDMKRLLGLDSGETNQTRLDEVVNMIKVVASSQQQNAEEMRDEIRDMKRLLNQTDRECITAKPVNTCGITLELLKQARVSALRCEYLTLCPQNTHMSSLEWLI